jgi:hypothetical protein
MAALLLFPSLNVGCARHRCRRYFAKFGVWGGVYVENIGQTCQRDGAYADEQAETAPSRFEPASMNEKNT